MSRRPGAFGAWLIPANVDVDRGLRDRYDERARRSVAMFAEFPDLPSVSGPA